MPRPFFSIITATFNAEKTLPRLLDSLAAQTTRDFNWIVQDGASKDATLAIAERYRSRLPEILLESVPDSGIYDAWNRALDRTEGQLGKWVLFLGADDLLAADDVLEKAKIRLSSYLESVKYCCGDIGMFTDDGMHKDLSMDMRMAFKNRNQKMTVPHSSLFNRSTLFTNNRFDANFKIAGDYEFLLRTWNKSSEACNLGFTVTHMSLMGCSSNEKYGIISFMERHSIRKKYFPFHYYISLPKIFIVLANYKCHPQKMWLKNFLMKSAIGKSVWSILTLFRKKIIG